MPIWTPSPEDLQRVFDEQNPWHHSGEVPASLAHPVERPLAKLLWARLLSDEPHRFQLILGPRRVGKTTALYQTIRRLIAADVSPSRIWWLRLDHPLLFQQQLGQLVRMIVDVSGAEPDQPVFLMLDELVYSEGWDLWLKTFFDDQWPVRIAATSSATAAQRDRRLESGVGRWSEQHLMPYLFTEYLDLVGHPVRPDLGDTLNESLRPLDNGLRSDSETGQLRRRFMLTGGFPELLSAAQNAPLDESNQLLQSQQILRNDAIERAIYKDIPQSFGVDSPTMLERLLYVLAAQVTGLLSPTNISSSLGISNPTFDRYLTYLERAFLIFTLPNYSGRESSVQKRGRKLYFVDGAVRNAALQRGLAPLDNPQELGALTENLVASTLHTLALLTGVRLYHWRDGKHEVDLVLDTPEKPIAFEIGLSPEHSRSGLKALIERHPRFEGNAYVVAPQASLLRPEMSASEIGTLPLDLLLQIAGAQAERALARNLGA